MGLSFDLAEETGTAAARIKVVGVGGAGGNAIRSMIESQVSDVEFIVANTDIQALSANPAPTRIQLGRSLTKGLGAGANPEIGKKAAMEDVQLLQEVLQGADMVFVTAGMGGGTGTGAAPVIAQVARDLGALTVGVVTKPFLFEGKRRARFGEAGLDELANHVDTLITIPNQKLVGLNEPDLTLMDAFRKADDVLVHAVQGISDLIQQTGMVNVDFADVKAVMTNMGMALMGIGYGRGESRALDAARAAINSPLLDNMSVHGATGILINFTGGADMRLGEINDAATMIMDEAHEDANIIFGSVINPDLRDAIKVTVIATGFGRQPRVEEPARGMPRMAAPPVAEQRSRSTQGGGMAALNVPMGRDRDGGYANPSRGHERESYAHAAPARERESYAHAQHHAPAMPPRERESLAPARPSIPHEPAHAHHGHGNAAVHTRPSVPDVPAAMPSRRPLPPTTPRERYSFANDAELDIPTFLRNRGD